MSELDDLRTKYLTAVNEAADDAALESARIAAVGKKGEVALKMRELGKMTPEERQTAGPALNALKDEINAAISAKKSALGDAILNSASRPSGWMSPSRRAPARTERCTRFRKSPKKSPRFSRIWALK